MSSYDDSTLSSSNAFSPSFLHRIGQRDEPPSAGEADVAGPWRILEMLGKRFGVFRLGGWRGPPRRSPTSWRPPDRSLSNGPEPSSTSGSRAGDADVPSRGRYRPPWGW
jgi:hypothetical protein